jgi:pimeloyl-ACP methyl ester carboxylesterase
MPLVERRGLSFHVQTLGPDDGPPVCFVHGLLVGSMTTWYFGAAAALARRCHVQLYDLRGHGKSARPRDGYDLASMTEDLDALLDRPRPFTLVGHSWGAVVALRYAIDRPDRVERLVLVEAPIPPRLDELGPLDPQALLDALPAIAPRGGRAGAKLVEQVRALAAETTLLADLAAAPDFSVEELASAKLPVLLVYGDRSSCRAGGERLARALPSATLRIIDGGHFLPVESPRAVTAEIEAFLG